MNPATDPPEEEIALTLPKAHALVFFEFLSRFTGSGTLEIHDQAEQRVFWNLCCDLERVLVEPFRSDYDVLLQRARDAVRDTN